MARTLIALWSVLLLAIATILVLAASWSRQRQAGAQQRSGQILQSQLVPFNRTISSVMNRYEVDFQREFSQLLLQDPADCVSISRLPITRTLVVVRPSGELQFPERVGQLSTDEASLVDEALQLLREQIGPKAKQNASESEATESNETTARDLLNARSYQTNALTPEQSSNTPIQQSNAVSSPESAASSGGAPVAVAQYGWITWYHRRAMILGFWWQQADGWRAMAAMPTARWKADIVAALPDGGSPIPPQSEGLSGALDNAAKQLVDVEGNLIYQWGNVDAEAWEALGQQEPDAELRVVPPLEGWRLGIFASSQLREELLSEVPQWPIWLSVVGISTALVMIGVMATINIDRQFRLAQQRVSFVNHVSHELRTPLTNIRMYADLLAQDLELKDDQQHRIGVIQSEGERLSRLISNVLQLARPGPQPLRMQRAVVDETVSSVVDTFVPRLQELGFELSMELNVPELRRFSVDAVEQMLVNLIANAEKYAAGGKRLIVATSQSGDCVTIRIADDGPGIAAKHREAVFAPFKRFGDRLIDPAGTGIGLTIARDLARRHGGDCRLEDSESGATFVVMLDAPLAESDEP